MAQAARGEEGAEVKRDEGKQTTQPDPAAVRAAERWDRGAFADDPTYGHTEPK